MNPGIAITDELLLKAASLWDVNPISVDRSVDISGSPERSEFRDVVIDSSNVRYVIESIPCRNIEQKKDIVARLDELSGQRLWGINTYLKTGTKESIVLYMSRYWQISRFVEGVALKRPDYIFDKWRGKVLAEFLINLRGISSESLIFSQGATFSLKDYIFKLLKDIKNNIPELLSKINPLIEYLEKNFMLFYDKLDTSFCHGDYHPLNVIWGKDNIRAIIDWEFSGIKPEIYDAANLLGCLGIERPDGLTGSFACEFISQLQKANIFSDFSWQHLVPFVVALRFAWLSEWLRKKDTEMITLELIYMKILVDNEKQLNKIWKIKF